MGFDLSHAKQVSEREEQGADVVVKDELGNVTTHMEERNGQMVEVPDTITVAGKNSFRFRRKKAEQDRRPIKGKLNVELANQRTMELVAACVIRWNGLTENGLPYPCNEANAVKLFTAAPWVMDACVEAMEESERFSQSSSSAQ